ncbi:helix-hairpin-helix domain-containing protein [Carnobacterium funditum]|uniref:helix-hairpin-helix domain-containing protein n=1 Tax=Carnobacterium funditum TaxID=2752 RepID=UPI000557682B|nr:helix-hairpin-helix domain-containing protein [Carnobacterium funditum]
MNDLVEIWLKKRKMIIAISTIVVFLFVIVLLLFILFSKTKASDQMNESLADHYMSQTSELQNSLTLDGSSSNVPLKNENEAKESIYVDVKGAVQIPGVYEINATTRLTDVIILAGGFLPTADQSRVNLSQKLTDQMMIIIPTIGAGVEQESSNETDSKEESPVIISIPNDLSDKETGKVNLNTADITQLQTLSGIGGKKAERILQYRQEHGSFKAVEELKEVSGIGDKTFEALADFISVGKD